MSEPGKKAMTIIFKGSGRVDTMADAKKINDLRIALLDRNNRNTFISMDKELLGKNFSSIDIMPSAIEYITIHKVNIVSTPPKHLVIPEVK